jgi:hypothetical protein
MIIRRSPVTLMYSLTIVALISKMIIMRSRVTFVFNSVWQNMQVGDSSQNWTTEIEEIGGFAAIVNWNTEIEENGGEESPEFRKP